MHRIFASLLAVLGLAGAAFALETPSPALNPPPPVLESAEQDGQGVIWAYSRSESNKLYAFDGSQWAVRPVAFEQKTQAMPAKLVRMPNGAVACVWRSGDDRMAVTLHRGTNSSLAAQGPGIIPRDGFPCTPLGDSKNRLWITGTGPEIYRTGSEGNAFFTYRIPDEDLLTTDSTGKGQQRWNPLCATEDGRGRVWIWTNTAAGRTNLATLQGVMIFDGDSAQRCDIAGIQKTQFSVLARKDSKHLWLGVIDDGLYEVDIDTLQARYIPGPEGKPFLRVESVFSLGDDLYVLSKYREKSAFWRLRDGQWERLVEAVDQERIPDHPWIPAADGLLLCADPTPWFIGKKTPPVRLDWSNGFPTKNVRRLFHCADNRWFGIGNKGTLFHQKLILPPQPQATGRVTPLDIRLGWVTDADGHLWTIPNDKKTPVIREWTGEAWRKYPLPANMDLLSIESMAADQAGRIWLLPDSNEYEAAYFDSREKKWRTFSKIETVFQELKNDPPQFINPRRWFYIPQYSAQRDRIAYRNGNSQLVYFDGTAWRRWKRADIAPGNRNTSAIGAPFFDASDKLCVNIDKDTWQFDGHGAWKKTVFENHFPTDELSGSYKNPARIEVPPSCVTKSPDSIAMDNQGGAWLTWSGALYKCREGACAKVFADGEPNPFTASPAIREVWVARGGHAFLKTGSNPNDFFQITPKRSPPKTTVTVTPTADDAVRVKFQVRSESKLQFHWRLDDEPWRWTGNRELALDTLPNGLHTLQVQAFDEELQSDAVPVAAKFEIKIDAERQIGMLVAQLADPDFARRKAAIKALARQPAAALAALKAARSNASDDLSWWIDAARQAIEHPVPPENANR